MKNQNCKVCKGEINKIPFAKTPISGYRCSTVNESLEQPSFELTFNVCKNCGMTFYPLDAEALPLLDKLYTEHVSTYYHTKELSEYMSHFVASISKKCNLSSEKTVLEVGCNSGRLLSMLKEYSGCKVIGVEPSKTFIDEWNNREIEVINDYFDSKVVDKLRHVNIDVIIVRHVFEHIPDPLEFFRNLTELCHENSIISIEVPYLKLVLDRFRLENVSFSHLNYFTLRSLSMISELCGFSIVNHEIVETDGGSFVVHFKRGDSGYKIFDDRPTSRQFDLFLERLKVQQKNVSSIISGFSREEVVGFGAGSKGPHLAYILGLGEYIDNVIDETPEYLGKFLPGSSIKIVDMSIIKSGKVKAVLNLAPTHSNAIRAKFDSSIKFFEVI